MERRSDTVFVKARIHQLEARLAEEVKRLARMEGRQPPVYHKIEVIHHETVFERALRRQINGTGTQT